MEKVIFREVPLENRNCDVCGSEDLELLWFYEKKICSNKPSQGYLFKVNNVICRDCGFTFVSPSFNEDILAEYYGSSLRSSLDQSIDYDISFRMGVINKHFPNVDEPKLIEIGPSVFGEFQKMIAESFTYVGIEPSSDFGGEWKKIQDFKEEDLADVVAHYFVLEHIPNPLKFLNECNRLLKMNGIMIVEVPNIAIYPVDPVALYLYEHQNHFSASALACLAARAGFAQVEYTDQSSRTFGMTAVFRKVHEASTLESPVLLKHVSEYEVNKQFFNLGLAKVNDFTKCLFEAKKFIESSKVEPIILWGANQNLLDFLASAYPNSNVPDFVIFIDSDSRKRDLLINYDSRFNKTVFTPAECIDSIKKSSRLIIFTRRHKEEILNQIFSLTSQQYKDGDVLIVDINP